MPCFFFSTKKEETKKKKTIVPILVQQITVINPEAMQN